MSKLTREPLVQFLVLGVLLYFCIELVAPPNKITQGAWEVVVSDDKLKAYLQYQRKSFNPAQSETIFSLMSKEEQQTLTESFIRDEVLFQEAISLGLNQNDEIIRRRLIQKMEYLAQGFYDELPAISEAELESYFLENPDQYRMAASISFTHVFISFKKDNHAQQTALTLLADLDRLSVAFEDSGEYGDRYLFNRNYIERTPDYIFSHFGEPFQKKLFKLLPGKQWQGPITSEYGAHLVLIKGRTKSRVPELSEVAQIVLADAQRIQQREAQAEAIRQLVKQYKVRRI